MDSNLVQDGIAEREADDVLGDLDLHHRSRTVTLMTRVAHVFLALNVLSILVVLGDAHAADRTSAMTGLTTLFVIGPMAHAARRLARPHSASAYRADDWRRLDGRLRALGLYCVALIALGVQAVLVAVA